MSFFHLSVAAAGVVAWFALWAYGARRIRPDPQAPRFLNDASEAVLLTLFAALWFGSLGHGQWWLLFGVLALLVEGPIRGRHRAELPADPGAWRALAFGTVRLLGAGAILSLLL